MTCIQHEPRAGPDRVLRIERHLRGVVRAQKRRELVKLGDAACGVLLRSRRAERLQVPAKLRMVFPQRLDRGRRVLLQGREQRFLLEQQMLEQAFAQPREVAAVPGPTAPRPAAITASSARSICACCVLSELWTSFMAGKIAARQAHSLDVSQAPRRESIGSRCQQQHRRRA